MYAMNKIFKSAKIPEILIKKGKSSTDVLVASVESGEDSLFFDRTIYADSVVKEQLKNDQNKKCAYCERFLNGDYGAVEHFRPKAGYIEINNGKEVLKKPGYYWLAYDWKNLLYSCSECNTSYKRNYFPLEKEEKRNIALRDITEETPLLINPVEDNLEDLLEFHRYMVVAKDNNEKGNTTINLLKLNERKDLVERRRREWEKYKEFKKLRDLLESMEECDGLKTVKEVLNSITGEDVEFTGMFKYQKKGD